MRGLKALGAYIRAAREARGWSRDAMVEPTGRNRETIGAIERAEQAPSLDTLLSLIRVLELDPIEVILMLSDPQMVADPDRLTLEAQVREVVRSMDSERLRLYARIGRVMTE